MSPSRCPEADDCTLSEKVLSQYGEGSQARRQATTPPRPRALVAAEAKRPRRKTDTREQRHVVASARARIPRGKKKFEPSTRSTRAHRTVRAHGRSLSVFLCASESLLRRAATTDRVGEPAAAEAFGAQATSETHAWPSGPTMAASAPGERMRYVLLDVVGCCCHRDRAATREQTCSSSPAAHCAEACRSRRPSGL